MEKQKKKYGLEAWLPDKDADPYFGTARDMELYRLHKELYYVLIDKEKVIKQLRISNIGLIVCVSITVAAVVARLFLTLG